MKSRHIKAQITSFCFILPALTVLALLLLYPVITSVYYSFTSKHLIKTGYEFVFLKNYIAVLTDGDFWKSFLTNIKWTVTSLFFQILVGFFAALALERIGKGKSFFRTVLIIPWAFPSIVIALSWKWILNGVSGFLPNILVKLGICDTIPQFLSSSDLVFPVLVMINVWFGAPLIMVNVLSALQTVPRDQYEAAQVDGASPLQSFLHITLPHIRIVMGLLIVLRTIWIFNSFDLIFLLTGGGPGVSTQTMPIFAYRMGWTLYSLGRSSAVTILLLIILAVACTIYFKVLDHWESEVDQG